MKKPINNHTNKKFTWKLPAEHDSLTEDFLQLETALQMLASLQKKYRDQQVQTRNKINKFVEENNLI